MDKLLLIDDERDMHYSFRRIFDSPDLELIPAASGEEGLRLIAERRPDLVLLDIRLGGINGLETLRRIRHLDARLPVILMTAYGTTQTAIEAMKLGAYDYLLKPFDVPRLKHIVGEALRAARAMRQIVSYQPLLEQEDYELGIIGRSPAMQEVFKLIGQLAASDATALITGESGTGKELVARAIYHHSRRSRQPFLAVNCAAIPEQLLESELFGHEKGAFTGATHQRIGRFEQCHGGTIFLDEIGDMSPATQTKILRVLQEGTFERVGGNATVRVDVRVIAATNQDLERAVAEKRFREDLFYRLNVVRVRLPPLRERPGDIPLLADYFLRRGAQKFGRPPGLLSAEALALLERHSWPGNVRELENALQHALVVAKGETILPADLPASVRAPLSAAAPEQTEVSPPAISRASAGDDSEVTDLATRLFAWARSHPQRKVIEAVERALVVQALKETRGNQVRAAQLLGMTRATLRKRIERFGIRREFDVR